jgi:hypothetical protein
MMLDAAILASSSIKSRQLAKWHLSSFIPKVAFHVVIALIHGAVLQAGTNNKNKNIATRQ